MTAQINKSASTNKTALAGLASSNVPVLENQTQNQPQQPALDGADSNQGDNTMNTTRPGFWATVKTAFAWGFGGALGGAIGWGLGNWLVDLVAKFWRWIVLLGGSYVATHGGLQAIREALF